MASILSFLLRFLEAGIAASVYVLLGLLLAGFMRIFIGSTSQRADPSTTHRSAATDSDWRKWRRGS